MLVISSDAVPDKTRINRNWLLAESLSLEADIILALPELTRMSHPMFAVVYYNRRNIDLIARDSDAVVCDPVVIKRHPALVNTGASFAIDLAAVDRRSPTGPATEPALEVADFFFCPDENSRNFWLEALNQCGRINPHTRKRGKTLRRLIDVAALPEAPATGIQARKPKNGDGLKALKCFCSSPRFARDRGTVCNRAKLPARETQHGLLHYLRRLRYHLKTNGTRMTAAHSGALIKRKISGH